MASLTLADMARRTVPGARPMAKKKHWMKAAFANSHGQFKAKAEHAGKSTAQYAREKKHAGGRLGRQANLALRGIEASHGKSRGERWYGPKE